MMVTPGVYSHRESNVRHHLTCVPLIVRLRGVTTSTKGIASVIGPFAAIKCEVRECSLLQDR